MKHNILVIGLALSIAETKRRVEDRISADETLLIVGGNTIEDWQIDESSYTKKIKESDILIASEPFRRHDIPDLKAYDMPTYFPPEPRNNYKPHKNKFTKPRR